MPWLWLSMQAPVSGLVCLICHGISSVVAVTDIFPMCASVRLFTWCSCCFQTVVQCWWLLIVVLSCVHGCWFFQASPASSLLLKFASLFSSLISKLCSGIGSPIYSFIFKSRLSCSWQHSKIVHSQSQHSDQFFYSEHADNRTSLICFPVNTIKMCDPIKTPVEPM